MISKQCHSPYINHFVSADTIVPGYSNPQDLNRYSYVGNNPLTYTDPTGHMRVADQDMSRNRARMDCSKYPQYCNGGKPKSNDDLVKMRNKHHDDKNSIPILGRLSTGVFVLPVIVSIDVALTEITLANTAVLPADPEPVTKAIFLTSEIMVSAADIVIAGAEVSYVHWIATGEPINKKNMFDWRLRP